jgi:hypothetical protein
MENTATSPTLPVLATAQTCCRTLSLTSVNLRTALKSLLILVLGLPIASVVLTWVAGLLAAMGDANAANVLSHINTAVRVIWLVSLVGIVVVLGLESLDRDRDLE